MKITIKTLKNKKYELEIQEDDDIISIKKKIHETLKLGTPEQQHLIHHGKILKDDQTVKSAGFKEADFVVLMVRKLRKKKKPAPKTQPIPAPAPDPAPQAAAAQAPAAAASSNAPDNAMEQRAQAAANPADNGPEQAEPAAAAAGQGQVDDSNAFVTGNLLQESVANLMAMGFPEADVQRALRAAFNNPQRAAEYLLNGIPANAGPPAAAQAAPAAAAAQDAQAADTGAAAAQQPAAAAANAPDAGPQLGRGQGGALGGMPGMGAMGGAQLNQLRGALAQNPAMVQAMVQQLAMANPNLARAIGQNPQALQKLLNDPQVMNMMMMAMMQNAGRGAGQGGGAAAQAPGPRPGTVRVTAEERAAIERLSGMGFSRDQALEAFLVCNKDEQLAANYLFDNPDFAAAPAPAPVAQPAPAAAAQAAPAAAQAAPAAAQAAAPAAQAAPAANEDQPMADAAADDQAQGDAPQGGDAQGGDNMNVDQ